MYNLSWLEFIVYIFAAFRLTHILVFDEIAEFIRRPFVEVTYEKDEQNNEYRSTTPRGTGIRKFMGSLLTCYWCTGVWCSTFVVLSHWLCSTIWPFLLIMAIAGLASIVETRLYSND
ncbi:MAG: Sporulation protein YjcA [Bacillota bacterium]|jgi:uncharacterized protein involved in cysteine biosynthesis